MRSHVGVYKSEIRQLPESHNGSSRNMNADDTLFQNSSCEPTGQQQMQTTAVNSPNNIQHFNLEQYSINSIISHSNQNSQKKFLPQGMGSSKQSTNIGSINQTATNALNTTRDKNHIQV